MGENVVFLVIFDTCDVMYNLSISLLAHIVLDNLFGPGGFDTWRISSEYSSALFSWSLSFVIFKGWKKFGHYYADPRIRFHKSENISTKKSRKKLFALKTHI